MHNLEACAASIKCLGAAATQLLKRPFQPHAYMLALLCEAGVVFSCAEEPEVHGVTASLLVSEEAWSVTQVTLILSASSARPAFHEYITNCTAAPREHFSCRRTIQLPQGHILISRVVVW